VRYFVVLAFVCLFVLSFLPIRILDVKGKRILQPMVQRLERTGSSFFVIFMTLCFIAPTFGFVPTIRILLSVANCVSDPVNGGQYLAAQDGIKCWVGGHAILFIVAVVLFVAFVYWALRIGRLGGAVNKTYESTANENNLPFLYFNWKDDRPDTNFPPRHVFSRRSVTYLLAFLIFKGLLVAFAVFSTNAKLIVSIFLAISCIMMMFRFIFPPFWNLHVNCLNAAFGIAVVWTNALALAVVVIDDPSKSDIPTALLVFGMLPLIAVAYIISIPFIRCRLRQLNVDINRLANLRSRRGRVIVPSDDSYPFLNRVHSNTEPAIKTGTEQGGMLLE